jgi:hypothetical protein
MSEFNIFEPLKSPLGVLILTKILKTEDFQELEIRLLWDLFLVARFARTISISKSRNERTHKQTNTNLCFFVEILDKMVGYFG